MKDILSAYRKRLQKSLAVLVIVAAALLLARGEGRLAFAFLLGLIAALVFVWNMAFRLWNLSTDAKTAHRQMLWGMFLRLAVLALVLAFLYVPILLVVVYGFIPNGVSMSFFDSSGRFMGFTAKWYGQIFGGGHMGFADSTAVYYLTENLILLIAGFIGCGTLVSKLYRKFVYVKKPTMVYVSVLAYVVLFGFCIAAMVSSTFSSFLYFQF